MINQPCSKTEQSAAPAEWGPLTITYLQYYATYLLLLLMHSNTRSLDLCLQLEPVIQTVRQGTTAVYKTTQRFQLSSRSEKI
jgi:hypothetical protein